MELTRLPPIYSNASKSLAEKRASSGIATAAVETVANLLYAVEVEADTPIIKEGWPVVFTSSAK